MSDEKQIGRELQMTGEEIFMEIERRLGQPIPEYCHVPKGDELKELEKAHRHIGDELIDGIVGGYKQEIEIRRRVEVCGEKFSDVMDDLGYKKTVPNDVEEVSDEGVAEGRR